MNYLVNLFNAIDFSLVISFAERLIAILLCLSIHEAAHAASALALGDKTAKYYQRISMNPLHHIDWFGMLSLLIVGVGWAKPVPVNPNYFRHKKLGMAITAFCGPLSNIVLAFVLLLIAKLMLVHAVASAVTDFIIDTLISTTIMSIGLGVFNLLPIPPLDGSKIAAVFVPDKYYQVLMRYERYGFILLIIVLYFGKVNSFINTMISGILSVLINIIGF